MLPKIAEEVSLLCLAGATASGKSDLALRIAQERDAEIINADALQIYREWRILTARPSERTVQQTPHFLYGCVSVAEEYTAAQWCQDATRRILENREKNRLSLLVGGTGLYLHTLLNGLAEIPEPDPDIRKEVRKLALLISSEELHEILLKTDPLSAAILHPNDRQRVSRALEVVRSTGKSILFWQKETLKTYLPKEMITELIVLDPPRSALYQKIDGRFETMIENGAIEETRQATENFPDMNLPGMKAVGAKQIQSYLLKEIDEKEMITLAQTATRQYAKRQTTWFKNKTPNAKRLAPVNS